MLAPVVIVSDDLPELLAMEAGLNAQVTPLGSPAHDSATAPLNPKVGATVTVDLAEFPAVTGLGDNAVARTSKPDGVGVEQHGHRVGRAQTGNAVIRHVLPREDNVRTAVAIHICNQYWDCMG